MTVLQKSLTLKIFQQEFSRLEDPETSIGHTSTQMVDIFQPCHVGKSMEYSKSWGKIHGDPSTCGKLLEIFEVKKNKQLVENPYSFSCTLPQGKNAKIKVWHLKKSSKSKKNTGVFFVLRIATFRSINLRQMYPQKPTAGSPEKTEKKHRHNWQITNFWGSSFQGCIHSYQKCKLAPRWFPNHPSSNPPPGVTQVASYDQHILGLFFEKISGPLHLLNGTLNHP